MQNFLENIDAYFSGRLGEEEKKIFEKKIAEDKNFAEEVAFYLSVKQISKEEAVNEKKKWFRQLAAQLPSTPTTRASSSRRTILYRLAAAAVLVGIIFLSWYLFFQKPPTPDQLADQYVTEKLQKLNVTMGSTDTLQEALQLYNDGHLDSSLQKFELILQRDPANAEAKKDAGIVYLRTNNYDKALQYFQQLGKDSLSFSNPAIFFQALTLMKRNAPRDKQQAKQLLQQVVQNDLEGRETAQQWLKKL